MRMRAPDLPEQLTAISELFTWATGADCIYIDTNHGGDVREANRVWGELRLRSIKPVGTDQLLYTDSDTPEAPMAVVISGLRLLGIQLTLKSRSQEFTDAAYYAALKAQTKIKYPYAIEKYLKPYQLSLASAAEVINMSDMTIFDDRQEDNSVIEVTFNAVVTDTDAAAYGYYIEQAELSSDYKKLTGVSLPPVLQVNSEVIP